MLALPYTRQNFGDVLQHGKEIGLWLCAMVRSGRVAFREQAFNRHAPDHRAALYSVHGRLFPVGSIPQDSSTIEVILIISIVACASMTISL